MFENEDGKMIGDSFGDLFPDFDTENTLTPENKVLLSSTLQENPVFNGNKVNGTSKKPAKIYKIKLNSSTDLQKILNAANACSNKAQYGNVTSSNLPNVNCSVGKSNDNQKFNNTCMSKNAVAARENRQKKKVYVDKLENSIKTLTTENVELKREQKLSRSQISHLQKEVEYLRSVLANVDEISSLVANIKSTPGMQFSTSLQGSKSVKNTSVKRRSSAQRAGNKICKLESPF